MWMSGMFFLTTPPPIQSNLLTQYPLAILPGFYDA